jgi:hypothetical protein
MVRHPPSSDLNVLFNKDALYPRYCSYWSVKVSTGLFTMKSSSNLKGIKNNLNFSLTLILFIDDILIFCEGNISYISSLKEILQTFYLAIGMRINMENTSLYTWGMTGNEN